MAVTETNPVKKAKLVYKIKNDEMEDVQTTRTFSNIQNGADNDAIMAGMSAMAGLLDASGVSVVKVTEATLVNE